MPRPFSLSILSLIVATPALAQQAPPIAAEDGELQADALDATPVPPPPPLDLNRYLPEPPAPAPFVDAPALPEAVRQMIELAILRNDEKQFRAVVDLANATQPQAKPHVAALEKAFRFRHQYLAEERRMRDRRRILEAGLFDLWKGEGQLGLNRATGNTDAVGLTAALKLDREGIDWVHKLRLQADYQRTDDVVSREAYLASYSPRFQFRDNFYAFGLTQFESDTFQGYASRFTLSAGLGYRVVDNRDFKFSIEGGPAYRWTDWIDEPREGAVSALATMSASLRITDNIRLTQDASAYIEELNSTFVSTTALESDISRRLKTRFSYNVKHETDPPDGKLETDTISRFSVVYGF